MILFTFFLVKLIKVIHPAVILWFNDFSPHLFPAYLTLKRLSLPTISPSFLHPLLLDLSSTSQSFFITGSLNKWIFVARSKESDMAPAEREEDQKYHPHVSARVETQ